MQITGKMIGSSLTAKSSPNEIAQALIGLRNTAEKARSRLMLELLHVEQNVFPHRDDWGHESFDAFLKAHEIVRPDVYREWVAGLEVTADAELAMALGTNVVRLIARVPEPRRPEYMANMLATIKDKGAEPSEGAARAQAVHCGMKVESLAAKRVGEVERLRARVAELESENLKLRRELAKAKKGTRKRAA